MTHQRKNDTISSREGKFKMRTGDPQPPGHEVTVASECVAGSEQMERPVHEAWLMQRRQSQHENFRFHLYCRKRIAKRPGYGTGFACRKILGGAERKREPPQSETETRTL